MANLVSDDASGNLTQRQDLDGAGAEPTQPFEQVAGQSITGSRWYRAYGAKRSGNDVACERTYTGQRLDDTGLLCYGRGRPTEGDCPEVLQSRHPLPQPPWTFF